jgi:hypothetical protein
VTNIQKPEGNFREFSLKNQGRADCEELLIDIKMGSGENPQCLPNGLPWRAALKSK